MLLSLVFSGSCWIIVAEIKNKNRNKILPAYWRSRGVKLNIQSI